MPRRGHQKGELDVSTPDPRTGLDDPRVEAATTGGATDSSATGDLHDLRAMLERLLESLPAVSRALGSAPVVGPTGQAAKGVFRAAAQISVPATTLCRDAYRGKSAVVDAVANFRWVARGAAAATRAGAGRVRRPRATGPDK
jgi:hypothetical protein